MPLSRIPPVLDRAFADAVARMVDADPPGLPVLDALAAFDAELAELVRTLREQLGDDGEVLSAVTDVCAVLSAAHGDTTRDAVARSLSRRAAHLTRGWLSGGVAQPAAAPPGVAQPVPPTSSQPAAPAERRAS
jgi:hypothetical protein